MMGHLFLYFLNVREGGGDEWQHNGSRAGIFITQNVTKQG